MGDAWYEREIQIDLLCENVLGITSRQYRSLAKEGKVHPVVGGHVPFGRACATYIDYFRGLATKRGPAELVEERTRLTRLSADRKELSLQKERGEVIEVIEATRLWSHIIMSFKKRLQGMPRKIAPVVFGSSKVTEIQEIMETEVTTILNELAEPDLGTFSAASRASDQGAEKSTSAPKSRRKKVSQPMGGSEAPA